MNSMAQCTDSAVPHEQVEGLIIVFMSSSRGSEYVQVFEQRSQALVVHGYCTVPFDPARLCKRLVVP